MFRKTIGNLLNKAAETSIKKETLSDLLTSPLVRHYIPGFPILTGVKEQQPIQALNTALINGTVTVNNLETKSCQNNPQVKPDNVEKNELQSEGKNSFSLKK